MAGNQSRHPLEAETDKGIFPWNIPKTQPLILGQKSYFELLTFRTAK